jgi:sugar/nucleoside kinase (ribokinase family)
MSLIVTGSIGIDAVELPGGERRSDLLGGSCAYFAAAASFHCPVRIVAVAGEDFPERHRKTLNHFRIDLDGLEIRKGKTFRWGGKYSGNLDQRETLFTELNLLGEAPARIPEEYKDSQYVFLANGPPALQLATLNHFPQRRLTVADTMDLWIKTAREDLLKLLKKIDGLVLNYDEAELLTGKRNAVAAARHILEHGPRFVIVKKGEHGAILVHKEGIAALPAYPAEKVVDPTGAGDSFAGGMMGHLAAEGSRLHDPASFSSVRRAMAHGTVMASFTIEAFSLDRLKRLTKEELDARFEEFTNMFRVH